MPRMYNKAKFADEKKPDSKPMETAYTKADSKKVPQQPDLSKTIEKLAYERWLSRGGVHGDDWSDWFEAEKLL